MNIHPNGGGKYHKSSYIGEDVFIGKGSVIGDRCYVGDGTTIKKNVIISNDTVIGQRCQVLDQARINEAVGIGDNVCIGKEAVIGYGVSLGNGSYVGSLSRIGRSSFLKRNSTVNQQCVLGINVGLYEDVQIPNDHNVLDRTKISKIKDFAWTIQYLGINKGLHMVRVGCKTGSIDAIINHLEQRPYEGSTREEDIPELLSVIKALKLRVEKEIK